MVGLELKYEVLKGELADPCRLAVPILAALAGMIVPALIYLAINARSADHSRRLATLTAPISPSPWRRSRPLPGDCRLPGACS